MHGGGSPHRGRRPPPAALTPSLTLQAPERTLFAMPHASRGMHATSLILAVLAAGGCDRMERYLAGAPEDRLAQAALDHWTTPGASFLDGVAGGDTVASVTATGARARQVAIIPLEGGAPTSWSLEVTRVETYPTYSGPAFTRYLAERGRVLGLPTPIPGEILSRMADGSILGGGEVEVRYGPSARSARATVSRVAFLVPGVSGGPPIWVIQDAAGPGDVFLDVLRKVAEDMMEGDERVRACAGDVRPVDVPRATLLACVRKVWEEEFGSRE